MAEARSPMRIGIIGAGTVTLSSHLPVLMNMPDVTIEWICDKAHERARDLSRRFRIRSAFADINDCTPVDAVLVAIPVGHRRAVMPAIAQKGWHALCEKPFALSTPEFDEYVRMSKQNNTQLAVALVRRYAKPTVMARKLLAGGTLGPIRRVYASEGNRMKRTGQEYGWYLANPSVSGGGVLMETGAHLVDQVFSILNASHFQIQRCVQKRYQGIDLASLVTAEVVVYDRPVECVVELSLLEDLCNGIFIEFPECILKIGLAFEDSLEVLSKKGEHICHIALEDGAETHIQGFALEWNDFLAQCRSGRDSEVTAESTRTATEFIEACYAVASS